MADLFFGNKDKEVLEQLASTTFAGKLDYPWLITSEAEIPVTKIFDYEGIAQFQTWLDTNTLSAPELIKGLNAIFTQKDKNGNILKPNCGFVAVTGITIAGTLETEAFYTELENRLANDGSPYYGIGFVEPTIMGKKWANTYPKKILPYFYQIDDTEIPLDSSGFVRVHVDEVGELRHIAEMAQFLFPKKFRGIKFVELTGMNPDKLTDGEVIALDALNLAAYRIVNGHGEITNSLTTNGRHVDERFIMDTMVYNIANALDLMFRENDVFDYNVRTLVEKYTGNSINYVAENLGMISKNENNQYLYSIIIPQITGQVRSLRELSGIEWRFIQATPIEKTSGTAMAITEESELTITVTDLSSTTLGVKL